MDWVRISENFPDKYDKVLVCQDLNGDRVGWFFVANYWESENQWVLHLHFSESKCDPYIRITRKTLQDDEWSFIVRG